jgi:hypothetical protein
MLILEEGEEEGEEECTEEGEEAEWPVEQLIESSLIVESLPSASAISRSSIIRRS